MSTSTEHGLYKDVDCSTCAALCCRRGIVTPLSDSEARFMSADNKLTLVEPPKVRRLLAIVGVNSSRPGQYRREEDCSHLTSGVEGDPIACDIHDSPERPDACADFKVGDYRCRQLRFIGGIDTEKEFAEYVEITGEGGVSATIPEHIIALAAVNSANRHRNNSLVQ